jgi:hypothetical protein
MRFWIVFAKFRRRMARRKAPSADNVDAVPAGLTMRQRGGAVCVNPERRAGVFMISKPRQRLLRRGESPLSDLAAR